MLTQTQRTTKAGKIERVIHVERQDALRATITEHRQLKTTTASTSTSYKLRRIDADFGIGVEVEKLDGSGEIYHVNLDRFHSCDCPWGLLGRGPFCRHIQCCLEAQKRGLL